jgi:uncharacterized protein
MIEKENIIGFLNENRNLLRERFSVTKIGLFGSFARNEQKESSDIDLLIELEDNTPDIHELKEELRAFIGARFHRDVDLAREKFLKPYAREIILSEVEYVE